MVIFGQEKMYPFLQKRSVERYEVFISSPFTKQVKEIQEELDKLSPHKIKHTKKVWCNLIMINTTYKLHFQYFVSIMCGFSALILFSVLVETY